MIPREWGILEIPARGEICSWYDRCSSPWQITNVIPPLFEKEQSQTYCTALGYLCLAPFPKMAEKETDQWCRPGSALCDCSHPRDKHPFLGMLRAVPIVCAGYSFTAKVFQTHFSPTDLLLNSYIIFSVLIHFCLEACLKTSLL